MQLLQVRRSRSHQKNDDVVVDSGDGDVVDVIELDYGKIYRKALYLMVKTMVSCKFSLKPIQ